MHRFLLALWFATVILLMWTPLTSSGPGVLADKDLIVHFGVYLILGSLLLGFARREGYSSPGLWATLVLLFAGVATEVGQFFVPGRSVSILDGSTNLIGGLYGLYLMGIGPSGVGRLIVVWFGGGVLLGTGGLTLLYEHPLLELVYGFPYRSLFWPSLLFSLFGWLIFVLSPSRSIAGRALLSVLQLVFLVASGSAASVLQTVTGGILFGVLWLLLSPNETGFESAAIGGVSPLILFWLIALVFPPSRLIESFGGLLIGCFLVVPTGGEILRRPDLEDQTPRAIRTSRGQS